MLRMDCKMVKQHDNVERDGIPRRSVTKEMTEAEQRLPRTSRAFSLSTRMEAKHLFCLGRIQVCWQNLSSRTLNAIHNPTSTRAFDVLSLEPSLQKMKKKKKNSSSISSGAELTRRPHAGDRATQEKRRHRATTPREELPKRFKAAKPLSFWETAALWFGTRISNTLHDLFSLEAVQSTLLTTVPRNGAGTDHGRQVQTAKTTSVPYIPHSTRQPVGARKGWPP